MTYAFEDLKDGGTHFEFRVAKPKPKDLPFHEQIWPTVQRNYAAGFETLRLMLEERAGSPAGGHGRAPGAYFERTLPHPASPRPSVKNAG